MMSKSHKKHSKENKFAIFVQIKVVPTSIGELKDSVACKRAPYVLTSY